MRPFRLLATTLPALCVLLSACGGKGDASAASTVRDSAGVSIVESKAARWKEGEGWTVTMEPAVSIGVEEGPEELQLSGVSDVVRLSDGRVAVADGGSSQVRLFDGAGRHVGAVGRAGEGPGEFRHLAALRLLPGDSLLAYDGALRRITLVAPDGKVAAIVPLAVAGAGPLRFVDRFADGTLLVSRSRTGGAGGKMPEGAVLDSLVYLRLHPVSGRLDSLAVFPAGDSFVQIGRSGGTVTSMNVMRFPFSRTAQARVAAGRVHLAWPDRWMVRSLTPDGALARIASRPVPAEPFEGAYADALRAQRREDTGAPAKVDPLEGIPLPKTLPAFGRMLAEPDGHLWLERFARPGDDTPRWDVLDPRGRHLGTVTLPRGLRLTHVAPGWVTGVRPDEMDVERVESHALRRGGR